MLLREKLLDAGIKTVYFPKEWSTRKVFFQLTPRRMKKKSVLTENYGFENNVTSTLLAVLEVFGLQDSEARFEITGLSCNSSSIGLGE